MDSHKNLKILILIDIALVFIFGFLSHGSDLCSGGWNTTTLAGIYNCPAKTVSVGLIKNLCLIGFVVAFGSLIVLLIVLIILTLRKSNNNKAKKGTSQAKLALYSFFGASGMTLLSYIVVTKSVCEAPLACVGPFYPDYINHGWQFKYMWGNFSLDNLSNSALIMDIVFWFIVILIIFEIVHWIFKNK